ncbi:MAG: hypothetical protein JHC33_06330 [Ignisphaera sp.]|nr:hypothetical protein [Ignisphaera sp.]
MSYTEVFIEEHRKAVFIFEGNDVIIIVDLYPCELGLEAIDATIDVYRVRVGYKNISVREPFSDGRIEIACIGEYCTSIALMLRIPYTVYASKGLDAVVEELKAMVKRFEPCLETSKASQ